MKKQSGFTLIELLIVVAIIGIIAAIAIPSLLRARVSANEAAAIGDSRTISSANAVYASSNGGAYDAQLTCLSTPSNGCIPGYPAAAPTFLDPALAVNVATKQGYTKTWTTGPAGVINTAVQSPSSVPTFCYQSVPVTQNQTGVRGFGIDHSGMLCFNNNGAALCAAGVITAGCTVLQ